MARVQQHHKRPAKAGVKLVAFLSRARRDERGVAAYWFGLVLACTLPLVAVGMNLHMASSQKLKMQDALDAATLYAARSKFKDEASLTVEGKKALAANLVGTGVTLSTAKFYATGGTVTGEATGQAGGLLLTSKAMGLEKFSNFELAATSDVVRAVTRLEVVLVLDNTGSMQGAKITNLKTAATSLVNKLEEASKLSTVANPLRIGLVPFSNTVRFPLVASPTRSNNKLSMSGYTGTNQAALGVPAFIDPKGQSHWDAATSTNNDIFDVKYTDRFTKLKGVGANWFGCLEARRAPYDIDGSLPSGAATQYVPYFAPDEPSGYWNDYMDDSGSDWKAKERLSTKYTGGSQKRTGTFNPGSGYGKTYYLGPNAGCELAPMIPLTDSFATIRTAIADMNAMGETNIPLGLAWGWNMLNPDYNYFGLAKAPEPYKTENFTKVIVLMTDGDNTFSSLNQNNKSMYGGLGYAWQKILTGVNENTANGTRTSTMDSRLTQLCTKLKGSPNDVIIYAVRVEVDNSTSTALKNCASPEEPGHQFYFEVANSADMEAVFLNIAGSISDLRVSK